MTNTEKNCLISKVVVNISWFNFFICSVISNQLTVQSKKYFVLSLSKENKKQFNNGRVKMNLIGMRVIIDVKTAILSTFFSPSEW